MPKQRVVLLSLLLFSAVVLQAQDKPVQIIFSPHSEGPDSFSDRWELRPENRRGTFIITPYKPMTLTAGRWSSSPNVLPVSENPDYSATSPLPYNKYEAKYNISFKTKIIQGLLHHHADLWIAYSQKSFWQLYNSDLSRPFRETNYEPEIILNFPLQFHFAGLDVQMAGIAFNHQSNGRSLPYSRSWNRVIGHLAAERRKWAFLVRGWYRLPDDDDENPAIADYVGRADMSVIYKTGRHAISLMGAHSLRTGAKSRGIIQADYVVRLFGNFKAHWQIFHGYGESLVDYNHKQTGIGLGICLVNWL